jgi:hypothetical protein
MLCRYVDRKSNSIKGNGKCFKTSKIEVITCKKIIYPGE